MQTPIGYSHDIVERFLQLCRGHFISLKQKCEMQPFLVTFVTKDMTSEKPRCSSLTCRFWHYVDDVDLTRPGGRPRLFVRHPRWRCRHRHGIQAR